jgi:hypothetical protein
MTLQSGPCAVVTRGHRRDAVQLQGLMLSAALLGVLQNDPAPIAVDNPPFPDLVQRSKAAEAGKLIVQAAIAYAGRGRGVDDGVHGVSAR